MKPSDAIADARVLLNDPDDGGPRWSQTVLLRYFNDGMKALAKTRGDLFQEVEQVAMVAGELQGVSRATSYGLVDVIKNSRGVAMREIDAFSMSLYTPKWRARSRTVPTTWSRLNEDAFRFYVYPPAAAGDTVTVLLVRVPQDIVLADIASDNGVSDAYRAAAANYIAGRALTMNTNAADTAKGQGLLAMAEGLSAKPTV